MNSPVLLIPGMYFFRTRLNRLDHLLFHGYAEWLASLIILFFLGRYSLMNSLWVFLISYAAFLALYEIGYFCNDFYAVAWENNPRRRLQANTINASFPVLFIAIRLGLFSFLSIRYFKFDLSYFIFFGGLAVAFALHNLIREYSYKLMTFACLAFMRFCAPFFFFISAEWLKVLTPGILLFYVFYRSMNYLDSKDLLRLPQKKEPTFKVLYYLLLSPITAVLAIVMDSWVPVAAELYFLLPWAIAAGMQKAGILKRVSD